MDKGYYKKSDYKSVWFHLLLRANHKDREFCFNGENITVREGQFITGRKQLSLELGISESKIERILTFFEKSEKQIEQQKTNKNRMITILRWKNYQQIEQQKNSKRTTVVQKGLQNRDAVRSEQQDRGKQGKKRTTSEQQKSGAREAIEINSEQQKAEKHLKSEQQVDTNKNVNKEECNKKEIHKEDFPFLEDKKFYQTFQDYLDMRKTKKPPKPATDVAKKLVLIKLHKHDMSIAMTMLENAITGSWTDVYELKPSNSQQFIPISEQIKIEREQERKQKEATC